MPHFGELMGLANSSPSNPLVLYTLSGQALLTLTGLELQVLG